MARHTFALLAPALVAAATLALPAAAQDSRELTNVRGDVYKFRNNFHNSMVVITPQGVIVGDPINAEAATWLEAELATLTDQPVTHLIYSHSHGDHASGGAVFADTATTIAHENAPETIDGVAIDTRIGATSVIEHGGKTIELTWLGEGHGADLIAMVVRPENVAFAVDAVSVRRLPWRDFGGANLDGFQNQIAAVEALDFEVLLPGHGNVGDKGSVAEARGYMDTLRTEVGAALAAGKTVEDLHAEVTLPNYADWTGYDDWRTLNIDGMAAFLQESGQVN
jgi:glyoxylase-like metal-dependent hydrolase (beta-lactamase superfamily II)